MRISAYLMDLGNFGVKYLFLGHWYVFSLTCWILVSVGVMLCEDAFISNGSSCYNGIPVDNLLSLICTN